MTRMPVLKLSPPAIVRGQKSRETSPRATFSGSRGASGITEANLTSK